MPTRNTTRKTNRKTRRQSSYYTPRRHPSYYMPPPPPPPSFYFPGYYPLTRRRRAQTKKTKKRGRKKYRNRKGILRLMPSSTPQDVKNMSAEIDKYIPHNVKPVKKRDLVVPQFNIPKNVTRKMQRKMNESYAPTINDQLVTLNSAPNVAIPDCNNMEAFTLQEPLKISVPGTFFGRSCVLFTKPEAKKVLLKNLAANKHVDPTKIVPPVQLIANCWFNTMFVTLFVSDKGRKFFHFFRQLMIEGKQANGSVIPLKLAESFSLLNFAIDACLTGNKYAYMLDTNNIIRIIYKSIPDAAKKKLPFIVDIDEASNPLRYYSSIISYLHNNALQIMLLKIKDDDWKKTLNEKLKKLGKTPHIIIFEVKDGKNKTAGDSGLVTKKPTSFHINKMKYSLDSAIIRDTTQQHFSATLTCEGLEMGYDGLSYHRLVPLEWKKYINTDHAWGFEGSKDGKVPLEWNFRHGYQMLIYYRVK